MFFLLFLTAGLLSVLFSLAIFVLNAVAKWKVLSKAGQEGWLAFIPFVNDYMLFKISWNTHRYWIYIGLVILASVFKSIGGDDPNFLEGVIQFVSSLGVIYYEVKLYMYLAQSYGQSKGFGIFTYLIRPIGLYIIALGDARYQGPAGFND